MSISSSHITGLHSRYDPWREAEKFIQHSSVSVTNSLYVLIEPGQGYLSKVLLSKNPKAKIVEVHCTEDFENLSVTSAQPEIKTWFPHTGSSLSAFLSSHIGDLEIGTVEVVEWPPAKRVYPEAYARIKQQVRSFLQERRASIHTTGKFGRLWLRNTLKRVASLPPIAPKLTVNAPIVLAASGPSLQRALPLLSRIQDSLCIIALPSSICALTYYNIKPDIVVHSDPGFYGNHHLRCSHSADLQAAPLYASGYRTALQKLVILSTGSPIEEFFMRTLGINALRISPHGTVAGIAYQLASKVSSGPIIWAGLDLCYEDIQEHIHPHSFEPLFHTQTNRYAPLHDIYYRRSPLSASEDERPTPLQSFALTRYADWFQRLPPSRHGRFYRLFPSEVDMPAFRPISVEEVEALCAYFPSQALVNQPLELGEEKSSRALTEFIERVHTQSAHFFSQSDTFESPLHYLREYPLLYELMQYTALPLLFRLQQGAANINEIQRALSETLDEIRSIVQAGYL